MSKHPGATFQDEWNEALPEHHVITFARGGAPHDDIGFAILEVASLDSFAGREPDARRPEEWPEEGEWLLEVDTLDGARRWSEPVLYRDVEVVRAVPFDAIELDLSALST